MKSEFYNKFSLPKKLTWNNALKSHSVLCLSCSIENIWSLPCKSLTPPNIPKLKLISGCKACFCWTCDPQNENKKLHFIWAWTPVLNCHDRAGVITSCPATPAFKPQLHSAMSSLLQNEVHETRCCVEENMCAWASHLSKQNHPSQTLRAMGILPEINTQCCDHQIQVILFSWCTYGSWCDRGWWHSSLTHLHPFLMRLFQVTGTG